MKKVTLKIFLIVFLLGTYMGVSQTLNQSANWPNAGWTLSGSFTGAGLLSNPTVAGTTFTWDDDGAGNGSADDLQATSPVIDLTAANGAGETLITISGDYVYRALGGDVLQIEVYDADALSWSALETFTNNSGNFDYQTCSATAAYTTAELDISGFTATQLSGFQYRITYDDLGGWQWGWCLTSPTITSNAPISCPAVTGISVSSVNASSAQISWTPGSTETNWEIVVQTPPTGIAPAGAGTPTTTNSPYFALGLTPLSDYEVWVRADCGGGDLSTWAGPETFSTPPSVVPDCPASFTATPDVACGNFDTTLSWDFVTGADDYLVTVGTTTGGNDILDNAVATTNTIPVPNQSAGTTYFYTVAPRNVVGTNTGCAEQTYATAATGCVCASVPTSIDGNGISNVRIGVEDFITGPVSYTDHSGFVNQLAQNVPINVQITFETGVAYDTNIWIDFNDNLTFEPSELVFSGTSLTANPTTFDASFTVPAAAATGPHIMRFGTAELGQATPEPCYNGADGVTLDFDVNVNAVACVPATVTSTTVVPDCVNGTFSLEVEVSDPGTAFFISASVGPQQLITTGTNVLNNSGLGFPVDTPVDVITTHLDDGACNLTIPNNVNDQCPPPAPNGVTCGTGSSTIVFTEEFADLSAWTGDIDVPGDGDWETNDNGVGSGGTGPSGENSGPVNSYMAYEASSNESTIASAVSPAINLTNAVDGAELAFFMHAFGADIGTLNVGVGTAATGPFTNIWSYSGPIQTAATDPWTNIGLSLDAYLGQVIYIEYSYGGTGAGFEGDLAIDSMTVEACGSFCFDPSDLAVSNVTETSADIAWTANSGETAWEYVVQAAGGGTPAGAGTAAPSNPFTEAGLSSGTAYEVWVRANCGGGSFSLWVGPVAFTTPIPPITAYPYTEDFESGSGGWIADNTANGTWELGVPANAIINSADSGINAWVTDLDGPYLINDNSFVTSPPFDMSSLVAPAIEMSIWYNSEFSWDGMLLQSSIDGGTSWQNVGAFGDPNNWYNDDSVNGTDAWTGRNSSANGSGGWLVARNNLTGLAGQSNVILRVAFFSDGSVTDEGVAFDTVTIEEVTCPDVSAIAIDSVTETTATISWTPGGTETNWEVLVQADDTGSPSTGTATTDNPYTETGLTANTAYEVYVRADCGGGSFSAWIGPIDFTTPCTAFAAPYTEDFENGGAVPDCWTNDGAEAWLFNTSGPNHVGNAGTLSGSTTSGGYYAVLDDSTPDPGNELASPLVDLTPLTNPALEFYLISNDEGQASASLTVEVFDGAAWNNVGVFSGNTGGWAVQLIDLSGLTFTGPAQVRFSVADSGSFYDDIAIDDVSFIEGPTCFDPTGLTVSSIGETTAEITWISGGSTSWEIVVQTPPTGTAPTGAGTTTTNPFTATSLTTSTDYEVWLRADCGSGTFSAWVGPVLFSTTAAAVTTFPYSEDFDAGPGGWTADNTTNGTWALGAPTNTIINSADSGTDAWVTNLTGPYNINEDSFVTSPPFDMSALANPVVELSIWYNSEFSWDGMVLQSSINGGASWQNVGALGDPINWYNDGTIAGNPGGQQIGWTGRNSSANGSGGWLVASNNLTGLGGQSSVILRVAFGSDGSVVDEGVAFDTVSIVDVSCPDVTALTIDSAGLNTAQISWTTGGTETDWEIVVQTPPTGLAPTGSGTATTDNPYTATGLTDSTLYEVWVRPDCGGGDFGDWTGPVTFSTQAPTVTTYPYNEDFDAGPGGWSADNTTNGTWELGAPANTIINSADSGTNAWVTNLDGPYNANDNSFVTSPIFDMSALGAPAIELSIWYNSEFSWDGMVLQSSIDGGTSWQNVGALGDPNNWYNDGTIAGNPGGQQIGWSGRDSSANGSGGWLVARNELTGLAGQSNVILRVAFGSDGSFQDEGVAFDTVSIVDVTCPDVSLVQVANITTTTVDVSWTNGDTETAWEVAVQAQDTGEPVGAGDAVTTNPYTATGLTAQTDYEVWVRPNCGGGDFGNWTGPVNFSSACNTFALPLIEGFESGVPPQCWSSFRGTNGAGTANDWESSPLSNSGSASAFVSFENSGFLNEDWLVTPAMDLNGTTNPEVAFFAAQQFTGPFGSVYTIRVSTTDTDIASFTTVQTYTEADLPVFGTDGFSQFAVDLSAYNTESTVYVAFVMENDDGDNFFVDDVIVWDNQPGTYTYTDGVWAPFTPPGNDLDDIIVAAGNLTISEDFTCNTMTVNPGAATTVDAGVTLTATNGLSLESSATSYSSLIRNGSITGAVTYERHVNINGSGTTGSNDLISAPLTGQPFDQFRAANPNIFSNSAGTLFLFGPFNKGNGTYVTWSDTETATLDPGVGYRAASDDNGSFTFVGTDNNGLVTNDIQNAGINNPEWNLVGNPYPSYLNVQAFLTEDVGGVINLQLNIPGTAGIWGYDGSALNGWTIYNLATTTPSTLIAPGQGFMVSADPTNDDLFDLEFTPAMRRTGSSDDFIVGRNASLTYVSLHLTSATNGYSTDFYFNAKASQGFDLGYDAAIWGYTPPAFSIYSRLVKDDSGDPMTIQALKDTDFENVTIPLGVNAGQGEQITFSIGESTLPANIKVYLDDTVENTTTLLNTSDYVMTPKAALSGTGRFFLRYEVGESIENSLDALDIFTLNESDELVVSGELEDNATLNLFDIQGRRVLSITLDSDLIQNRINVATINAGIYLATVQSNSQEITKKVIIE